MQNAPQNRNGFQVAIFCALSLEAENVQSVLDICWEDHDKRYGKAPGDQNTYSTGTIGKHNVVLVHMPSMGGNSAALAAAGLRSSFRCIQLALVVGICGVAPVHPVTKEEIVLGDVVISTAVIQYDFSRQYPSGFVRRTGVEDILGRASPEIRSFINKLKTRQARQRFGKKLGELVSSDEFQNNVPTARYPGASHDRLYEAAYVHENHPPPTCDKCLVNLGICTKDCKELQCKDDKLVHRKRYAHIAKLEGGDKCCVPSVHLGRFGSANMVMKSGLERDRISEADDIVAFEMEGAGVWEQYPTVIIKSACDYSDSHKNKNWQNHAAAVAAVSLKLFLDDWVMSEPPDGDEMSELVWHLPIQAPGFIGRKDVLQRIRQLIFDCNSLQTVALLGLGGVGKSRLALEFAYMTKAEHPHYSIFWVQASNKLTFERDMLEIGKKLKIPSIEDKGADFVALVKQRLSLPTTNNWIMILDNADDEDLWGKHPASTEEDSSLVHCLPKSMHGSVLITTRTRFVASFLAEKQVIELQAMTEDDAAKLFESKLENPAVVEQPELLSELTNKLANLPLAVVQASSYINLTQASIQTYLDLLNQPEAEVICLLSKDFGDTSRYPDAVNPVAKTWLVSFKHMQTRHPLAVRFFSAMACLHEKGIPLSLLPEIAPKLDTVDALAVLLGYSFISKQSNTSSVANQEELYDMHRLVQLAARSWLQMDGTLQKWIKTCTASMAQKVPKGGYENKALWTMYMPHAQRICELDSELNYAEHYELLYKMAWCQFTDGKYHDAVKAGVAVADWRQKALGLSDHSTLDVYCDLGMAFLYWGDLSKAEYYLGTAKSNMDAVHNPTDDFKIRISSYLAILRSSQGKYAEAETLHRDTLQRRETVLGVDHPDTLTSMNDLALVLREQGKYAEAETLLRDSLQRRETVLGADHPNTLTSMNNLVVVLREQGKYVEVETLHRDTLQRMETVFSVDHPDTLTGTMNLATILRGQGKYAEAETLYRDTLQRMETVLSVDHPNTLTCISNLALVLRDQGKYAEAETLSRDTLQRMETVLGVDHPDMFTSINNLAVVLRDQGKYAEAETLHRDTLQRRETVLGVDHPDTLNSMSNLAVVLRDQGKYVEAETLHRDSLQRKETVLGADHPHTLNSMSALAVVLRDQGKYVESETLHRDALQRRETVLGADHPDVLTSMSRLAWTLIDLGRTQEAVQLMRSCVELRVDVLGRSHPHTQESINELTEWTGETYPFGQQEHENGDQMPESSVNQAETTEKASINNPSSAGEPQSQEIQNSGSHRSSLNWKLKKWWKQR